MVVFDASMLIDLFNPRLKGERRARIDLLMKTLTERKQKVIVPAPAYTEFMVGAKGARDNYQARVDQASQFKVEPFGQKAAMECATILARVFTNKEKGNISRTKVKFDWMIVATAKSTPGVTCIYCGDGDVERYAQQAGVAVCHVDALPLPPQKDWIAEDALETPAAPATPAASA